MKKITTIQLIIILFLNLQAFTQVSVGWVSLYNHEGSNTDKSTDLVVDAEGNIYITGWTTTEVHDFITVKYNSDGVIQWSQFYNGPMDESDQAEGIAIDDSGNVYVIGRSQTMTWGDITIIKYSPDGDQLWVQNYDNTSTDGGYDIGVGENGMIYAVGYSNSDMITLQYNPEGELQWASTYDGSDNSLDIGYDLVLDASSNVYITGYSQGTGTGRDITTIKYNDAGVEQWVGIYDGPGHFSDEGYEIALDELNNVYVVGYSNDEASNIQFATIKYNTNGEEEWVNRYYNPETLKATPRGLAVMDSENIYVTGSGVFSMVTIKLNAAGDTAWTKEYGSGYLDQSGTDIITDEEGNVYACGWVQDPSGVTQRDYGTVKYNPDGDLLWDIRYGGPSGGIDDPVKLCLDSENNIIVTGNTMTSANGYDIATIKYMQSVTSNNEALLLDNLSWDGICVFPNPAENWFKVRGLRFKVGGATLLVYGLDGRKLIEKQIPEVSENFKIDVDDLENGLYCCTVRTEKYSLTKKLIIQK